MKPVRVLRSLACHLASLVWTLALGLLFLPAMLIAKKHMLHVVPRLWTKGMLWFPRLWCGIGHEVRGREHIAHGAAIYAMKHQSAWETLALWQILPEPVFILKKELLRIPVFGQYLAAMPIIAIDRKAARAALESMLKQAGEHLAQGRQIVIFPEGTRMPPGQTGRYHAGVAALYEAFPHVPLIPVALNSGLFWGKNRLIRRPGTIVMEFLPAFKGKREDRAAFLESLRSCVEPASQKLLEEAPIRLNLSSG